VIGAIEHPEGSFIGGGWRWRVPLAETHATANARWEGRLHGPT
jgi:hypothetical protein